jgi:hypothetical protein
MTELEKIILTSCLTIFGGVVVIVGGQIIIKFFIEPIHDQFRLIGEIADSLIFYADLYLNPGSGQTDKETEKRDQASQKLRRQSSQLRARTKAIRWYELWGSIGLVLKRTDVMEASRLLMALSNSVHRGNALKNEEWRREIEKRLGIET